MSPNIGNLLNGVLIPNLLNNPVASCFLINLDFLAPLIAHFDNIIILPLLVLETCGSMFFVCFLHFKQYYSIFIPMYSRKTSQNYIIIPFKVIR